ncbi:MAG: hypothetical protein KY445_10725 [Armatimonadetes bacterium]|nr:hypothetical protein [Armatimonadota bacterium]
MQRPTGKGGKIAAVNPRGAQLEKAIQKALKYGQPTKREGPQCRKFK